MVCVSHRTQGSPQSSVWEVARPTSKIQVKGERITQDLKPMICSQILYSLFRFSCARKLIGLGWLGYSFQALVGHGDHGLNHKQNSMKTLRKPEGKTCKTWHIKSLELDDWDNHSKPWSAMMIMALIISKTQWKVCENQKGNPAKPDILGCHGKWILIIGKTR